MKKTVLAGLALLAGMGVAQAVVFPLPLTLTGPDPNKDLGPQSASNPCIIAGTNCSHQAAGMGYNLFDPNSGALFDRYSTNAGAVNVPDGVQGTPYNALALAIAAGGVTFDVALDVNTTAAAGETLTLFQVIDTTQNKVLYEWSGSQNVAENISNNGNGFGDWLIGDISLTGIGVKATDGILFHAMWCCATDGAESFFIVDGRGGTSPTLFDVDTTPLPAAAWLFGSAIGGGALLLRRRRKERQS